MNKMEGNYSGDNPNKFPELLYKSILGDRVFNSIKEGMEEEISLKPGFPDVCPQAYVRCEKMREDRDLFEKTCSKGYQAFLKCTILKKVIEMRGKKKDDK